MNNNQPPVPPQPINFNWPQPVPVNAPNRLIWNPINYSNVPLPSIDPQAPLIRGMIKWDYVSDFYSRNPDIENSNAIFYEINNRPAVILEYNALPEEIRKNFISFLENRSNLYELRFSLPESIKDIIYTRVLIANPNNNYFVQRFNYENKYMKYKMKYINLKKQF
jgi:hypothetical protein